MSLNMADGVRAPGGAGGVQGPGSVQGPDGADSVGGSAKTDDVSRFQDAMGAKEQAESAQSIQENAVAGAGKTREADSLGDKILKGIGALDGQIQSGRAGAMETLSKENVTQADLIKAQGEMMASGTLVSLVSKTASSLTQSVKTLQQG